MAELSGGEVVEVALERLYAVYSALPEFANKEPLDSLRQRAGDRYLALVYCVDGQDVGFKLGFALNSEEFYSWLGGVLPDFRGSGAAQAMLDTQEAWARGEGFQRLRVKSMNRYPAMLRLLIRNGYQIDGFTPGDGRVGGKIHFYKSLIDT